MSTTIREQIIAAIGTALARIRTAYGYRTEMGAKVNLATPANDPDDLPMIVYWPKTEESNPEYRKGQRSMPVRVEGQMEIGTENPSTISERVLADVYECLFAETWTLPYTSGKSHEPVPGDSVTGASSSAVGYVEEVVTSAGSWASATAAGHIVARRVLGMFTSGESIDHVSASAVCVIGSPSGQTAVERLTGSLGDRLEYVSGGIDDYPESGQAVGGAVVQINVVYRTINGDPYHQGDS